MPTLDSLDLMQQLPWELEETVIMNIYLNSGCKLVKQLISECNEFLKMFIINLN
jgi:hypothetical protein